MVIIALFFLKMLYGRYYVGWNKIGITIRIKSFVGKLFNFKDVKSTDLQNGIRKNDIEKIIEIIAENTVAKNVYN